MGTFTKDDFSPDQLKNLHPTGLDLDDDAPDPPDTGDDDITPPPAGEGEKPKAPVYVFGEDYPVEELRGKSPEDAAKLIQQLERAGRTIVGMLQTQTAAPAPAPQPVVTTPPPKLEPADLLEEDKLNAKVDELFSHKMRPIVEQNLRIAANSTYQNALSRYPRFQKYAPEVTQFINSVNLQQAADPRTWDYLDAMLARNHAQEEMQELTRKTPPPPNTSRGRGIPENESDQGVPSLSADELYIAKRLGVDPTLYAKQKAKMGLD